MPFPSSHVFLALAIVAGSHLHSQDEPARIPWQRSLDDALEVSRLSGRPLLFAVNNDGEAASEQLVRYNYRDPAFIALTTRFVPVILSPVRHTPLDHDEAGKRVPCPRFGVITCGEHMRAEPIAYERWFNKRRVAPRHVGVEPNGTTVLFDLFLLGSLSQIEVALEKYGGELPSGKPKARASSRDAVDRATIEAQFFAAKGRSERRTILKTVERAGIPAPDLLRLAILSEDDTLREQACAILCATAVSGDDELVRLALGRSAPEAAKALLETLERIAPDSATTRRAAVARAALGKGSSLVNVGAWKRKLKSAAESPESGATEAMDVGTLGRRLEELYIRAETAEDQGLAWLAVTRAHLEFALFELGRGSNPTFHLRDADERAKDARKAGAKREEVDALRAVIAWHLGEPERTAALFEVIAPRLVKHAAGRDAARALEAFALARTQAVYANAKKLNPGEIADVVAAAEVLVEHPLGTAAVQVACSDLLGWLGLTSRREELLEAALERFPLDGDLHDCWRRHVQDVRGFEYLEAIYAKMAPPDDAEVEAVAAHTWFTAYAVLVVAEGQRKSGDPEAAEASYLRAESGFLACMVNSGQFRDSAEHYIALAFLGRANAAIDARNYTDAIKHILHVATVRPQAFDWPDGFGTTGRDTLSRLQTAISSTAFSQLAEQLQEGLEEAGFVSAEAGGEEGA